MCMDHDQNLPGIESQGHRSTSKVNANVCATAQTSVHCPLRRPMAVVTSSAVANEMKHAAVVSGSGGVQRV